MNKTLDYGDRVLFIDKRDRRYLVALSNGGEFHTHSGVVKHNDVVGLNDGSWVTGSNGARYLVITPRLSDIVLKMPRGAQVIYPKDIAPILLMADIKPGIRVLEAGVGSGALSMAMLRAGAHVSGYEIRDDFANKAKSNVAATLGEDALNRYEISIRDVYEGIDGDDFDRVILDLPEPWQVTKHAYDAIVSGGIIVSYSPTITQTVTFSDSLRDNGFALIETTEVLQRTWHIEGQSVRPDHRMVAHTGFLTAARKVEAKMNY
jgi:tRNA (adenine57-N1/adenine58-N1)-methyltransferase